MFNLFTKNNILRIGVEENLVKKLENWTHCPRMQQKNHMQKRNGTAKGSVSMSKPITISSKEIPKTRCATIFDMLAQTQANGLW